MIENQLKEEYFASLFEEQVRKLKFQGKNTYTDVRLVCTHQSLNAHISKLFKKYGAGGESFKEFVSEYALWAWKAIDRFEIKDDGSWEGILAGTDKVNTAKLIANIKTTTNHEIYRWVNKDAKFTSANLGNGSEHVTVKMEFNSLESFMIDGEEGALMDKLTEEDNAFFVPNVQYYVTYFSNWFNEHKTKILTKNQVEFLENLDKCTKVEGYTPNDVHEVTGIPSHKVNTKLKRMASRVQKAWEKEKPYVKNRLEMARDEELKQWNEFLLLVYAEEDLLNQNQMVTNWLSVRDEDSQLFEIVSKSLTTKEMIEYNRAMKDGCLKAPMIMKITTGVENRIRALMMMDCRVKPVSKTKEKAMIEWENQKKIRDTQPAFVFSSEGEFLRREEYKPFRKSKNNILYVLPSGLRIRTDGELA